MIERLWNNIGSREKSAEGSLSERKIAPVSVNQKIRSRNSNIQGILVNVPVSRLSAVKDCFPMCEDLGCLWMTAFWYREDAEAA